MENDDLIPKNQNMRSILVWISVIILLVLVGLVILADLGRLPGFLFVIYAVPFGDKLGHLGLMALLAFALNLVLRGRMVRLKSFNLLAGTLAALLLVTVEEISQQFFPTRSFSLIDLSFSYVGILLADLAYRLWFRNQASTK
jgi:hypothetical protein